MPDVSVSVIWLPVCDTFILIIYLPIIEIILGFVDLIVCFEDK